MAIIKHFILWLLTKVHFKIYIDIKMLIKDAQIRLKSDKQIGPTKRKVVEAEIVQTFSIHELHL